MTVAETELNHRGVKLSRRWGSIDRKWEGRENTEEIIGTLENKTTKYQVVETDGGGKGELWEMG